MLNARNISLPKMIRLHVKDGSISTEPEAAEKSLDFFNTLAQENDAKFSPIELEQDISIYYHGYIFTGRILRFATRLTSKKARNKCACGA